MMKLTMARPLTNTSIDFKMDCATTRKLVKALTESNGRKHPKKSTENAWMMKPTIRKHLRNASAESKIDCKTPRKLVKALAVPHIRMKPKETRRMHT